MLRPLTYSLPWTSRLTGEAWGSIFTVPLKEENMVEAVPGLKTLQHSIAPELSSTFSPFSPGWPAGPWSPGFPGRP